MEMVRIQVLSAGQDPGGKMKADLCGYLTLSWFFFNADPGSERNSLHKEKRVSDVFGSKIKNAVTLEPGEDPYFLDLSFEV